MNLQHLMYKNSLAVWLLRSSSSSALLYQSQSRCVGRSANSFGKMCVSEATRSFSQSSSIEDATNEDIDRREQNQQGSIRTRRPHNSYLKILMDDRVFEELHLLTQQLKASWEDGEHGNVSIDDEFQALSEVISDAAFQPSINGQSIDTKQTNASQQNNSKPRFKIKTRSLNSLHMTYFFCGTMLNEMAEEQISLLNTMLHERLNNIDNKDGKYWIKFKSINLFPPQRQNLIAASFESSPALDELYEELCDIAMTPKRTIEESNEDDVERHPFAMHKKEYEFPLLRSNVFKQVKKRRQQQRQKSDTISPWIAHVTLANIVGGKKGIFGEWLNDKQYGSSGFLAGGDDMAVKGLALGGPFPEHVDLDWNFPFDLE